MKIFYTWNDCHSTSYNSYLHLFRVVSVLQNYFLQKSFYLICTVFYLPIIVPTSQHGGIYTPNFSFVLLLLFSFVFLFLITLYAQNLLHILFFHFASIYRKHKWTKKHKKTIQNCKFLYLKCKFAGSIQKVKISLLQTPWNLNFNYESKKKTEGSLIR